jgi:hypothetical protein
MNQSTVCAITGVKRDSVVLSYICYVAGFLSIIASIIIWFSSQGDGSAEAMAHAERFGIFVGLWAPTFFILSERYGKIK